MAAYLINRVLLALVTIVFISILSFIIIHLPPGDYVDAYIAQLASSGAIVSAQEAANLRAQYGLDQPLYVQYVRWIGMIFRAVIDSVTRQPEMRAEITSIQWLGFALAEAIFFYGLVAGLIAYVL